MMRMCVMRGATAGLERHFSGREMLFWFIYRFQIWVVEVTRKFSDVRVF